MESRLRLSARLEEKRRNGNIAKKNINELENYWKKWYMQNCIKIG